MAVQAQLYTENIVYPLAGSQDLLFMENAGAGTGHFNDDSSFHLQRQQCYYHQQQQQQMQQMQFMQQLQNNNNNNDNIIQQQNNRSRTCSLDKDTSMAFDDQSRMKKKQRSDIDPLITLHSEKLRMAYQEHRRQQAILLKKYESEAQIILSQKDEEITTAAKRTKELNEFLQRMDTENKAWQRLAKEKEAAIFTLNNTINQLKQNAYYYYNQNCNNNVVVDDEESFCNNSRNPTTAERETETVMEKSEHKTRKMICKFCNNSRNPCTIILLPCRHLCSCKFCEPYICSCPVCNMPKKGSIEALF